MTTIKKYYYIMQNGEIVLCMPDKDILINALPYYPQLQGLPIQETDCAIENNMFVDSPEWIEWKSKQKRQERDALLRSDVDSVVSNPLRWASFTDTQRQQYADYRNYLINITNNPGFPHLEIKTFESWKNTQ